MKYKSEDNMKTRRWKTMSIGLALITVLLVAMLVYGRAAGGEKLFYWILSISMLPFGLIHFTVWLRTRNKIYIIVFSYYLFLGLAFLPLIRSEAFHVIFALIAVSLMIPFIMTTLVKKKINWRYREVLELAARPVSGTSDGFTNRPFPAGKMNTDRSRLLKFSRFLFSEMIAYPVYEQDRIILIIPKNMWLWVLFLKRNYESSTHIAIGNSGDLSVKIARDEYSAYRDELTFDQLCASMGDLFRQWFTAFENGKECEIINELNGI
jgi:hypothetical protein